MSEVDELPMGSQAQAKAFLQTLKNDPPPAVEDKAEPTPTDDDAPDFIEKEAPQPAAEKPAEEKRGPGRPKKEKPAEEKPKAEKPADAPQIDEYQQSLINEYEETLAPKDEGKSKDEKKEEKPVEIKPTQKELEYDSLLEDNFVKAVVEWRKNGGNNPKEFFDSLGFNEKPKTMREYFQADAMALGLEGEELEEAVDEAMDNFESLPMIERRRKELEYKNKDSQSVNERLQTFMAQQGKNAEIVTNIQNKATEDLSKSISELSGKKFKGLLIDEPMAKTIERDAPMFSPAIVDEQGNLKGYDIERGVRAAIFVNYGDKLLKETFMLGKVSASTQYAKERHRPNPDPNGGNAFAASGANEALDTALGKFAKKFGGS